MRKTSCALLIAIQYLILDIAVSLETSRPFVASAQTETSLRQSSSAPYVERDTKNWLTYKWDNISFRYPNDWQVEPQYYRTPSQENAGVPSSVVGLTLFPKGAGASSNRSINFGGRQMSCDTLVACKCFTIFVEEYTCGTDSETAKVFDLLLRTIRNDNTNSAFQILFPTAQDRLRPNTRYTIRWQIKSALRKHRVSIEVHDTSTYRGDRLLLDVKGVPNTGSYDWRVPKSVDSTGPYLLSIFFVKSVKVRPPATSGGRIYEGRSDPFYIY
jgi:hypothetical protein